MFKNQPKGLFAMALANTGERFGYYTMLAVFVLFLQDNFGWDHAKAGLVYSTFLMTVYFLPLLGGIVADRIGFGKCVTTGILVMFAGYALLAIPAGAGTGAVLLMGCALLLVCIGTSLFKGNLQVMIGNLYDDPKYAAQRDSGFSIFYMAINIGAMFAPACGVAMMKYAQEAWGASLADSYHYAFGLACISLVISIAIYYGFHFTFKHADNVKKAVKSDSSEVVEELSAKETKERIVALCLVFAVVVFFWMAFQQSGLTLTYFANECTVLQSSGANAMLFDIVNLVLGIVGIYGLFGFFQSKTTQGKVISAAVVGAVIGALCWKYSKIAGTISFEAPIFQQFNAAFVVALTPVIMAVFGWLASKGKEPSAPKKIGLGMIIAALGYVVMTLASVSIDNGSAAQVSPNWLVLTFLVLTFAELLLSPIGISFVSKVAPPKYKGMMMGGWFVATAVGNMLTSIPAMIWGNAPLWAVWGVLIALCTLSAIVIFSIMKKLEAVTKE